MTKESNSSSVAAKRTLMDTIWADEIGNKGMTLLFLYDLEAKGILKSEMVKKPGENKMVRRFSIAVSSSVSVADAGLARLKNAEKILADEDLRYQEDLIDTALGDVREAIAALESSTQTQEGVSGKAARVYSLTAKGKALLDKKAERKVG